MAISKISSSSIDPNVSLGDGFLKVDSTNNRVGIGTSSPASSLSFPIGTTPVISQVAIAGSAHSADNVGSLGLAISDGGGYSGVFVHNTHDGTFSSQDIRFLTAKGGNSVATERMRIDSAGRVTMPYQPAFQAYNPQGQHITGNTEAAFNSTYVNIGGHYNTSTGRFTAPIAGRYAFHFDGLFDNLNNHHISMRKNGIQFDGSEGYSDGTNVCISKSMVWNLAAGDYVSIFVDTTSSRIHQRYGSFCGYLLG